MAGSYSEVVQSISSHPVLLRFILILSFCLRIGLQSSLFADAFQLKILWKYTSLQACCMSNHLILIGLTCF